MKDRRIAIILIALVFILSLPATANAAKVKINKKSATINVGKTVQLKITGTKIQPKWSSSKKSVATVTKKEK